MAINFPDSPSVNDTHTVGDKTWVWDGTVWSVVVGAVPTTVSELTISNDLTVDTDTLHVDATNDRVGIGTTTPSAPLEIQGAVGSVRIEPTVLTIGSNNDGYEFNIVGGTPDSFTDAGGRIRLGGGTRSDGDVDSIIFMRDTTEAMRIDSSGNVGVNTTNPTSRIHLYSNTSGNGQDANYLKIDRANTSTESAVNWATAGTNKWFLGTDNTGSDDLLLYDWVSGNTAMYADSGTGILTFPKQPAFKAHASITNHPNGGILTYANVSYNIGNHLNASTGVFTAPVSGVYLFYGQLRADVNTYYVHSNIYINGANSRQYDELPGITGAYSSSNSGFTAGTFVYSRYINANDGISFNMSIPSGSFNVNSQTFIAGHLIG
jgi:hypothetical protein